MKIDAHQHFWKFNPVRDSWIGEEMKAIQKDFLPADLLPILQQNDFYGCLTVQSDQSEAENLFQLNNAKEFAFIKGIVGWVDLQADNVEERLEYYSQFTKMKGFRHVLQGEPQRDFMLRPAFLNGISLLHKYEFAYDILIYPDQLNYTYELVKAFPDQPFVVNHLAKPYISENKIDEWKKGMQQLATFNNVYCKVSGLVTEANWYTWKEDDFTPYLDAVTESFGTNRLMFGSDWPVCLVAASYSKMYSIVQNYYASFSENEKERIFGLNAMYFYRLDL